MKIELELTEEEWCELANALMTRAAQVDRIGDEGEVDGQAWANTLRRTYRKIAAELDEHGIPH